MSKKFLKNNFLFLFFLIFSSCNIFSENRIKVEIKNLSEKTVENIKVYTSDKKAILKFDEVKPGKSIENFLNMTNTTNSDGSYIIEFRRRNGILVKSGGGYYTNGSPTNKKIVFLIKNDTVLVSI